MYECFRTAYPTHSESLGVFPGPKEGSSLMVYQISHNGDDQDWEDSVSLCLEACRLNTSLLHDIGVHGGVSFVGMEAMGDGFTLEEMKLFSAIGGLTTEITSVIIPILAENHDLKLQLQQQASDIQSIKSQGLQNNRNIQDLLMVIRDVGLKAGLTPDEIFEDFTPTSH